MRNNRWDRERRQAIADGFVFFVVITSFIWSLVIICGAING